MRTKLVAILTYCLAAVSFASAQVSKPEDLRTALVGFGYDITDGKLSDDRPIYTASWKTDDGWTFSVDFSLTADKKRVWMIMRLPKVEDPKKIPTNTMIKLLAENDVIAPMSYSWDEKTQRFYLNQAVESRDSTPAFMRKAIDLMTGSARRTADFWDPTRWKE